MAIPGASLAEPRAFGDGVLNAIHLPNDAQDLLSNGWVDVTPLDMKQNTNSREYLSNNLGLRVRFDPGEPNASGWRGQDHYHIYNPNSTGKGDYYIDKDGNPTPKKSKRSHIRPDETVPYP